jgi:lipopolysaccharide/colanic/teichoic acid biosynthesis glycosyltransferase|uniref:Sugar transferase n=1 Tax=Desulfobacca acetoxidans TaxID=60893 RepID=A0A7C3SI28_9BACT
MPKHCHLSLFKGTLLLFGGDLVIFSLSLLAGCYFGSALLPPVQDFLAQIKGSLLFLGLAYFGIFYLADLYDYYQDFRQLPNLLRVMVCALVGAGLALITFLLLNRFLPGRYLLLFQVISFTLLITLWRYMFSTAAMPVRLRRPALVVGAGRAGQEIAALVQLHPASGLEIKGFVDDDPHKIGCLFRGLPVLGTTGQLQSLIRQHRVKYLILALAPEKAPQLLSTLTSLHLNGCRLLDTLGLYEVLRKKIPVEYLSDSWLFLAILNRRRWFYRVGKRVFDLLVAGSLLLLSWPLWVAIMVAIRWDTPGPVFFRQSRLGQNGKPFKILKFRSMYHDSATIEPRWTVLNDPRVTRVGRFLRRTHLDELPQLLNVLQGDMSLIGPRAEWDVIGRNFREKVPVYRPGRRAGDPPGTKVLCGYQDRLPYYHYRLMVKPGMTGWAQVMLPYAGSSLEELKKKLEYDLYYLKNMGFFLDLAILLKTVRIVLFGKGK